MEKEKITKLLLYPTLIRNFQARLAARSEAPKIARKMKNLCAELNTQARWDEDEQRLEIFPA